jgi:hypothetical protein
LRGVVLVVVAMVSEHAVSAALVSAVGPGAGAGAAE